MTKHIANIITLCRILGSILLLLFPAFSAGFYIVYLFCGFSDMIDGTVARKTNSESRLGSQLDTAADIVFVAVSLVKLLPAINLSRWLTIWGVVIAVIKLGNIIFGFVYKKKLVSVHTFMNKATGLLLFLLPLTIPFMDLRYSGMAVCSIATVAAVQEGFYVFTDKKTD